MISKCFFPYFDLLLIDLFHIHRFIYCYEICLVNKINVLYMIGIFSIINYILKKKKKNKCIFIILLIYIRKTDMNKNGGNTLLSLYDNVMHC